VGTAARYSDCGTLGPPRGGGAAPRASFTAKRYAGAIRGGGWRNNVADRLRGDVDFFKRETGGSLKQIRG